MEHDPFLTSGIYGKNVTGVLQVSGWFTAFNEDWKIGVYLERYSSPPIKNGNSPCFLFSDNLVETVRFQSVSGKFPGFLNSIKLTDLWREDVTYSCQNSTIFGTHSYEQSSNLGNQ